MASLSTGKRGVVYGPLVAPLVRGEYLLDLEKFRKKIKPPLGTTILLEEVSTYLIFEKFRKKIKQPLSTTMCAKGLPE